MKLSEIRGKKPNELAKILEEKKTELFGLRLKFVTGQLAKTHQLREARLDVARLATVLQQPQQQTEVKEVKKDGRKQKKK